MFSEISNDRVGRAVRRLRVSRSWSQAKFAHEVFGETGEHAFKTVSKIENGVQALSDDQLQKIEEAFGISLLGLIEQEGDAEKPRLLRLLGNREYFREHAEFIERALTAAEKLPAARQPQSPVDVFFFHPTEHLPVLQRSDVKKRWVENLFSGVNKHLVWPLIFAKERTMRMYLRLAEELLPEVTDRVLRQRPKAHAGRIYFWALDLSGSPAEGRGFYQQAKGEYEDLPGNGLQFQPILDVSADETRREALALRSVILNKSNVAGIASYSAIFVNQVCEAPGDEVISGWQYCGPEMHVRLEELAQDLLNTLDRKPKRISSRHSSR